MKDYLKHQQSLKRKRLSKKRKREEVTLSDPLDFMGCIRGEGGSGEAGVDESGCNVPDDSIPAGQGVSEQISNVANVSGDLTVNNDFDDDHDMCERRFAAWSDDFESRLATHLDQNAAVQNNRMTSLEAAIASINNALLKLTAPSTVAADSLLAQATGPLAEDPPLAKGPGGKSDQAAAVAMPNILSQISYAMLALTAPSTVAANSLLAQATGTLASEPPLAKGPGGEADQAAAVAMPFNPLPSTSGFNVKGPVAKKARVDVAGCSRAGGEAQGGSGHGRGFGLGGGSRTGSVMGHWGRRKGWGLR